LVPHVLDEEAGVIMRKLPQVALFA
jgi:hypothetical protein